MAGILIHNSDDCSIDINAKDKIGQTAFHMACGRGHVEVAKLFMDYADILSIEIDLNAKDTAGRTAYSLACTSSCKSTKELILKNADTLKIELTI